MYKNKKPSLFPLIQAIEMIGTILKQNDIVIYESTIYPGISVPILEKFSNLIFNKDFYCGYSPERFKEGNQKKEIIKTFKITSASPPSVGNIVNELYSSIITAGTYLAPTIKVAEAANVIENSSRDVNFKFVNELTIAFDQLGINTSDVLKTAGTKWHFLKLMTDTTYEDNINFFTDNPTHDVQNSSEALVDEVKQNADFGIYVASQVMKLIIKKSQKRNNAQILILGITIRKNCSDIQNSKVIDIIKELEEFGCIIDVYNPCANIHEVKIEYNINLIQEIDSSMIDYTALIIAIKHEEIKIYN